MSIIARARGGGRRTLGEAGKRPQEGGDAGETADGSARSSRSPAAAPPSGPVT